MRKVKVEDAPVNVNGGLVKLSKEQAAARAHNLRITDEKDVYEVVKTIQFKVGEEFEQDGEAPKVDKPAAKTAKKVSKKTSKKTTRKTTKKTK